MAARHTRATSALAALAAAAASCSSPPPSSVDGSPIVSATSVPATSGSPTNEAGGVDSTPTTAQESRLAPNVLIEIDGTRSAPIDPRVFGVNLPAWLGPERLADPEFLDLTLESGATLVRMPGGSWSNGYRWWACETGDEDECFWTWAARPSDFAGFMKVTGLAGMWTLSINESAQSAAAAVAFFNGAIGDQTQIGVDRAGVDWGTVDRWARLRADGGHPDPVRIGLWEVGNEVYGGRPESGGAECASFGWEDVWTCDGREYVQGVDGRDGFLTIRDAMLEVDPTVEVGAVGVPQPDDWTGWGREVIDAAGGALDFYIVHHYGFDASPSTEAAADSPLETWPALVAGLETSLGDTPIAVTEYNLVSFEGGDTDRTMLTASNALYLADTLGQMINAGVPIAAMWNLANGTTASGTDYGLIDVDNGGHRAAFEAYRMWSSAGSERLPAVVAGDVRLYPTRDPGGRIAVIVVNVGAASTIAIRLGSAQTSPTIEVRGVAAANPTSTVMDEHDGGVVPVDADGVVAVDVPAYSILVMQSDPDV